MMVFFQLHRLRATRVCVRVCFPLKLYCEHIWMTEAASPLYFGSGDTTLKRFSSSRSGLFFRAFPSSIRPSVRPSFLPSLPLARPSSGLHRGECVWDGVAVGLTGKQRFSLASKTSSRLSRVVSNVIKQYLGRLFSLPPTA